MPTATIVFDAGESTLSVTVSEPWPATPSLVAYTVAEPIFRAETWPPLVTATTEVSLDDHATAAEGTGWPAPFIGVAAAEMISPTSSRTMSVPFLSAAACAAATARR